MVPRVGQHLAVALLSLVVAGGAPAGEASGRFTVGERAIAPRTASAYPVRDLRDPRREAIEIVLSEGAFDATAAVAALDPHTQAINQENLRAANYILLWVRPDGDVAMNATFAKTMTQYVDGTRGLSNGLVAEITEQSAERVAGRVRTRAPVTTRQGETYSIDVTFATAVTRPAPGTPLAAGGGEPGRALAALAAAIAARDWPAMRAGLAGDALGRLEADYRTPEENRDHALDRLAFWLPKAGLRVTGGELRGDEAILEVEGEQRPGRRTLHLARMSREGDGRWRFSEAVLLGNANE